MISGSSWYSSAETHIYIRRTVSAPVFQYGIARLGQLTFLNVLNPAKIDPPIQVEYFRSGGA